MDFETYYRTTFRNMLFITPGVPKSIINYLIGYDYLNLNKEFIRVATKRYLWRIGVENDLEFARTKVNLVKNSMSLKDVDWWWIKTINRIYSFDK